MMLLYRRNIKKEVKVIDVSMFRWCTLLLKGLRGKMRLSDNL